MIPREFLDNLGSMQQMAARCIHCGFCNAVCPTSNTASAFKESRTSRGRVVMLQSIVEGIDAVDPCSTEFEDLMDLCYSCRRCVSACPAGIAIPDLISRARYAYLKGVGPSALTLGHRIFANYGTVDRLASHVAPLANFSLQTGPTRKLLQLTTSIDARANLPRFHMESFESWARKHPSRGRSKKIVYFVDSYANFNDPSLGKKVFKLLDYLGYQVIVPPQKESGMPALEYGLLEKARHLAEYNIRQLTRFAKAGIPIVCSSPAASFLLRDGYASVLEAKGAPEISNVVVDIVELLDEEYENGNLELVNEPPLEVVYQDCCLSKALSLAETTTKLLRAAGVYPHIVGDCCGGGGMWYAFKRNYAMSREIGSKLCARLEAGAEVITASETCKLQIEACLGTKVHFPLDLLAGRVHKQTSSSRNQ
jgi:Fe-S oxidoreductase